MHSVSQNLNKKMSFLKAFFICQAAFLMLANAQNEVVLGEKDLLMPPYNEQPIRNDACPLIDDPAHPVLLAYAYDCNKYYSCLNGWAYLLSCPPGLQWSSLTYRCDYPEVAKCQTITPPKPNYPAGLEYLSFSGDCSKYYQCQVLQCPAQFLWSSRLQRCVTPAYATCDTYLTSSTPAPTSLTFNNLEYLAYPNDCSKFLQCQLMQCPAQFLWNARLQRCDSPAYATCASYPWPNIPTTEPTNILTPTAATPPSPTYPQVGPWLPTYPQVGPWLPTYPQVGPWPNPPNPAQNTNQTALDELCSQTAFGYLHYPGDCHRFIQCNGVAFVQECPAKLYWNSELRTCDRHCK